MKKHSKTFYRSVARMKAIGNKDGYVFLLRLKSKMKLGYVRTVRLKDELVEAKVLYSSEEVEKTNRKGNINWKVLQTIRVPKEITKIESDRVEKERAKGLL